MNLKISFFSIIILIFLLFINLGNFLDVTEKPIKSDIIVCLGGGYGGRISKAIDLYTNSYSSSNKMILTGYNKNWKEIEDRRIKVLKKNNIILLNNIIHKKTITSTRNEIIFIKKYMIQHDYKKAIIVTDRPHSKRVSALLNILTIENDKHLSFSIVGSEVKWWNSSKYYENKTSFLYAIHEFIKFSYTYIAYGFLEKIGMLEHIKEPLVPIFNFIRNNIDKYIYKNTNKTIKNEN